MKGCFAFFKGLCMSKSAAVAVAPAPAPSTPVPAANVTGSASGSAEASARPEQITVGSPGVPVMPYILAAREAAGRLNQRFRGPMHAVRGLDESPRRPGSEVFYGEADTARSPADPRIDATDHTPSVLPGVVGSNMQLASARTHYSTVIPDSSRRSPSQEISETVWTEGSAPV